MLLPGQIFTLYFVTSLGSLQPSRHKVLQTNPQFGQENLHSVCVSGRIGLCIAGTVLRLIWTYLAGGQGRAAGMLASECSELQTPATTPCAANKATLCGLLE